MWYAGVEGDRDEQNEERWSKSLEKKEEIMEEEADECWAGLWWVIRYEVSSALSFTSGGEGRGKRASGRWCKRE